MQRRPSLTEGKLMIMRVLKSMEPLDENQLAEFFAEPDLLTFFEIKVALDELQGSELIAGRNAGNSSARRVYADGQGAHYVRYVHVRSAVAAARQGGRAAARVAAQIPAARTGTHEVLPRGRG